ncbi:hypothetical protein DFO62_106184 [Serratia fonticola]|nr:hypothetical protein DFO62_106184 [Serratia fonticola]
MTALSGWVVRVVWVLSLLMTGATLATADDLAVGAAPVAVAPDREAAEPNAPRWVRANEHILSFDTQAHFNPDGSMEMRENIKVLSLGQESTPGHEIFWPVPPSHKPLHRWYTCYYPRWQPVQSGYRCCCSLSIVCGGGVTT